ncbi:MAG: ATP-binding protein [Victivallales bacterium]
MFKRKYWTRLIENAWKERSIIWLSGVRRSGKTCLCKSLDNVEYFDCELPSVRRSMEDPEAFLGENRGRRIAIDEIHRLGNPSELLKIAADHYPETRIIATGSSSISASAKFKDTLTGRKRQIWLTPATSQDMADFNMDDLDRRFKNGGLPQFMLSENISERDFQEWMDDYWSKDIQELFRLERKYSFCKFAELLILQSSGIFQADKFAAPCEVSRPTISNYLSVLEQTYVAHIVRPFNSRKPTEIISAPKVYFFDTGFFCFYKGWQSLRNDDRGILWEHFVLNEIQSRLQHRKINYWRDKAGHEVDFVLSSKDGRILAMECKWRYSEPELSSLQAFRKIYPQAEILVVCSDVEKPFRKTVKDIPLCFTNIDSLINEIENMRF